MKLSPAVRPMSRLGAVLLLATACASSSAPPSPGSPVDGMDDPAPTSDAASPPRVDRPAVDSGAPPTDGATGAFASDAGAPADAAGRPEAAPVVAPAPAAPAPSPACGTVAAPGPDGVQEIQANGKDRHFIVRVPAAYDGKKPYPVIFLFHGAGGSAAAYDRSAGFRRDLGDKAILVFPDALVWEKTGKTTWMRDAPDDLAFFDATVAWLKTKTCIDTARIFSTGHSSGGFFSNTLGCQRGNVLRGIAPVSGGPREMNSCVNSVAAWVAHGAADKEIVPKTGQEGRDFWLARNGCRATNPVPTTPAPCVAYEGCKPGFPVHWCEFDGGHVWPAFANKALWDFFSRL